MHFLMEAGGLLFGVYTRLVEPHSSGRFSFFLTVIRLATISKGCPYFTFYGRNYIISPISQNQVHNLNVYVFVNAYSGNHKTVHG